jgi:hypothetical protein
VMSCHKRLWTGFLFVVLAGAAGCGVQDATQPPAGSISVGTRKDNLAPSVPPGKAKASPARH